jgi:hypothetical protein
MTLPVRQASAFSDSIEEVALATIQVDRPDRQRTNIIVSDLVESISKIGLMNPILVERGNSRLVAGERRLTAVRELGWATVPVRWVEPGLSPLALQLIELEENVKRQDLTWQDQTRAYCRIHALHRQADPDWTMTETAESVSVHKGTISVFLAVGQMLETDTVIWECSSAREAYNIILRRENRARGNAMEALLQFGVDVAEAEQEEWVPASPAGPDIDGLDDPVDEVEAAAADPAGGATSFPLSALAGQIRIAEGPPPVAVLDEVADSDILVATSFLDWAPVYTGKRFNFIHCDFPYGVNLFGGDLAGGNRAEQEYLDSEDTFFTLLDCFCTNLDRFCATSAHVMFWYSAKHERKMREIFAARTPSIVWSPYPLVWFKSDNKGIAGDHRRHPRHVHETCLFGYRQDRNLVRIMADTYAAPTARTHHVSAKPVPMLKHFFTMIVDEHTSILDPTCGSATSLQAAEALGAKRVLGLEIDLDIGAAAQVELDRARRLLAVGL